MVKSYTVLAARTRRDYDKKCLHSITKTNINVAPLNKLLKKMTAELQKLYKKIKTKFSEIDKDSDGYIVAEEVDTYMKSLDSKWNKADSIVRLFLNFHLVEHHF